MLFIANTFFEWELEEKTKGSIPEILDSHSSFRQLQFLPLLFLEPHDTLVVTSYPSDTYLKQFPANSLPKIKTFDDFIEPNLLCSWGASRLIEKWAFEKAHSYSVPNFSVVKEVNSKIWSFNNAPQKEGSQIVNSEKEIIEAIHSNRKWVLKTPQGFSGIGQCQFSYEELTKALTFAKSEFQKQSPLILEPWVERIFDFSSQWYLHKDGKIQYYGVTKCLNTARGVYRGTELGPTSLLFPGFESFIEEHLNAAKDILHKMVQKGYFGYVGIDSMVYTNPTTGLPTLQPIVEVNSRMTMALALLLYHKKQNSKEKIRFSYVNRLDTQGLLPQNVPRLNGQLNKIVKQIVVD